MMSLKDLNRVFPLMGANCKNQANYRFIHQLKTSSCFVLTRNHSSFNTLVKNDRLKTNPVYCSTNYYNLVGSRFQLKFYSKQETSKEDDSLKKENCSVTESPENKKLSLFQRIKIMYRDYWYILAPVHLVTSAFWFGSFYYLAKSGVDIVAVMKTLGFSESITNKLESGHSTSAYLALAYALYKIATPLRYTVTLGGTTYSINKLKELGYIKPIPPKEKLVEMYEEKRDQLKEKKDLLKERIQDNKVMIQERYQDKKAFLQEKYSAEK